MARDLGMGIVVGKRRFAARARYLRHGLGALVLCASCGTGNERFFTKAPDRGALSAMPSPSAAPAQTREGAPALGGGFGMLLPAMSPPAAPGTAPSLAPEGTPGLEPDATPASEAPSAGPPEAEPSADDPLAPAADAPPACPRDATFCTSFEEAELPEGASYVSQRGDFVPGESLLFDASERFSGEQSLLIPSDSLMFDYRMLSVAVPSNDFWVRLYLRTDVAFGDTDVDTLFLASTLSEGFNGDRALQLSEQLGQVVLNKNGQLHGAVRENPVDTDPATRLAADEWHCLEAFFGGTSGDVNIFLAGEPIITALAWQPETYQSFRFGYERFSTARSVWIDDVAVASARIGCQ